MSHYRVCARVKNVIIWKRKTNIAAYRHSGEINRRTRNITQLQILEDVIRFP